MTVLDKAKSLRLEVREKYIWILLPVLFAICFFNENTTWATNQFRTLVIVPTLLVMRFGDIKEICRNRAGVSIFVFFAWQTLTLIWDGLDYTDWQCLRREIQVVLTLYLVFLQARYQPGKTVYIENVFILFGLIWAGLVLWEWKGLDEIEKGLNYTESARGVFSHHVYVGWTMAVLSIMALWQTLKGGEGKWLYFLAFICFFATTLLVQSRGGYLVSFSGIILVLVFTISWRSVLFPLGLILVLTAVLYLTFQSEISEIFWNVITRGSAGRFSIWLNGLTAITESTNTLLFGHGLSSDPSTEINGFIADHYHNFFINLVFYSGLVGLLLYIVVVVNCLQKILTCKKARLWGVIFLAMNFGFIVDGDSLFVNPSAILLCVILPMGMIAFYGFQSGERYLWAQKFQEPIREFSGSLIVFDQKGHEGNK